MAPSSQGLYNPAFEHDACGVAMVADMHGRRSRDIVDKAIMALVNLEHRGAQGAEPHTGDGAGILLQVPDEFLRAVVISTCPKYGSYATGIAFLPQSSKDAATACEAVEKIAEAEGLEVLGWREVPTDDSSLGALARDAMPTFRQVFIAGASGMDLERRAYVVRKRAEHELGTKGPGQDGPGRETVYFPSLSGQTFVYKGMLTTPQLKAFYLDLQDDRLTSALGIVHSRFSTNTFPSWPLAHPFRRIAHNGEINTVTGNENWMRAREALINTDVFGSGPAASRESGSSLDKIVPVCTPGASDTARFDEVLELLHLGGRSLPHAVLMMIPEAWERNESMDPARRAFYEYHSSLMEPWDGPASMTFTDGTVIGAVLDRNGLRPSRIWVTKDGLVVMASEAGVLNLDPSTVVKKMRLQPGRMFLVDTAQGRIVDDEEIKAELAAEHPYQEWLDAGLFQIDDLPAGDYVRMPHHRVVLRQQAFGYTYEELNLLVAPMARTGAEPLGSMGTDTPVAVLSQRPRMLYDYFQQLFAQVTNPPLDAIREEVVTSLQGTVGPEGDLLNPNADSCRQIVLPQPILRNAELSKLICVDPDHEIRGHKHGLRAAVIRCLYPVNRGGQGLKESLDNVRAKVSAAIRDGARIIVLSDRESDEQMAPIPSLLSVSAVHHHLVRDRTRTQVGLVVEAGDAREVHHMACLVGFGAAAINPYMAFESIEDMVDRGVITGISSDKAKANYVKAAGKGVLKVMSKMGISTLASYTGAQLFQAIGISQKLLDEYFTGLTCPVGGIDLEDIADDVASRHALAYLDRPDEWAHRELEVGGEYQWRREGEYHLFNPDTVFKLQHSTRTGQYSIFKEYTQLIDDQSERMASLRGLLKFKEGERTPVPLDEVEPASEIVKRFSTGAMSYGSISAEAHETLAIAMNRLGGRSNSGEGGEDVKRFEPDENGDWRRSAIKQVASARFGVTSHYLTNCTDIQIKMAQGAKPGEGGQLPGNKVYPWVAEVRHSTPGVGLISPPPHHDIYSIEDLAQLIHDLKNANPQARVHVKLVSENGVGTVAAGRVQGTRRCGADLRARRRHRRYTADVAEARGRAVGARAWPRRSRRCCSTGLRDRIVRPGRRAAQDGPRCRGRRAARCGGVRIRHRPAGGVGLHHDAGVPPRHLSGRRGHPEPGAARAVRRQAGVRGELLHVHRRRSPGNDGAVGLPHRQRDGRPGRLAGHHAGGRALEGLQAGPRPGAARARVGVHEPGPVLQLAPGPRAGQGARSAADRAVPRGARLGDARAILAPRSRTSNRTVGTMLGHEVTKAYGGQGLPDGTIDITFDGSAGNSFGAFVPQGHHAAGVRRRQRLRRQGPLGWPDRGAPVRRRARGATSPRTTSSRAT